MVAASRCREEKSFPGRAAVGEAERAGGSGPAMFLPDEDGGRGRSGAFLCYRGDSAMERAEQRELARRSGAGKPTGEWFLIKKNLLEKHEANTVRKCPGLEAIPGSFLL